MIDFLKINTRSQLRKNKAVVRACVPYAQASQVGIVFTVEDKQKHMHVKDFIKKLESDGKKVTVICHLPNDKQNYEFLFDFFADRDFGFWGNLMSAAALKFSTTPFDYLLYLDTDPNPLILNLLARSRAKCRMGKHWDEGQPFFEFMVKNSGDVKTLMDDIYRYAVLFR